MKYEELKGLKPGDKVIVKVDETDKENHYWTAKLDGIGIDGWIENEAVIAVYHEPTKIKMTVEEKKEFDELLERLDNPNEDLDDFLHDIWDCPETYSNLCKRLFRNAMVVIDRKKQFEFARALENPDLVEIIKPKKYYVHLFPGERGYLNKHKGGNRYTVSNKCDTSNWIVTFTKKEIAQIPQDTFKITDKALEEVSEDE